MMDLGQLRSFAEVAERGTVAAAAAALGFTPPAISQHLNKLESGLGVRLFDRSGRRLRLTQAGERLLPIALQMIDLEHVARAAVTVPPEQPHFVVAGFASAISSLVVPLLARAADVMTIDIVEQEDADALRDLRLGIVDLVLTQEYEGLPASRDQRLVFEAMITDQLRLVLPGRLSDKTTIAQVAAEPWLVNGHGTRCTAATRRILETAGLSPTIAATVADNESLLSLVAANHGVTIVPELLLRGSHKPITVASEDLGVTRTIYAVYRKVAGQVVKPLVDLLTTQTQNSLPSGSA